MNTTQTSEYAVKVEVYPTRATLGARGGALAAEALRMRLASPGRARLMLAAAPSQQDTLDALSRADIDWSRVDAFHMDDYIGLAPDAPQGFATWLRREFVSRVPGIVFHALAVDRPAEEAAADYEEVMGDEPFDLVLLGLGVNGHLAFNDPPDARLDDPRAARVVTLDEVSRQQQVDEGHFPSLAAVPAQAVTVTIPRLLNATTVIASVPTAAKRDAVLATLGDAVGPACPGTALRTHPDVTLLLDKDSAP